MSVLQCMWWAWTEPLFLLDAINFATTHKGITPAVVTVDTVCSTMENDAEVLFKTFVNPITPLFFIYLVDLRQIIAVIFEHKPLTLIFEQHRCRRMSLRKPLLSAHLPQHTWILWLLVFVRIQT